MQPTAIINKTNNIMFDFIKNFFRNNTEDYDFCPQCHRHYYSKWETPRRCTKCGYTETVVDDDPWDSKYDNTNSLVAPIIASSIISHLKDDDNAIKNESNDTSIRNDSTPDYNAGNSSDVDTSTNSVTAEIDDDSNKSFQDISSDSSFDTGTTDSSSSDSSCDSSCGCDSSSSDDGSGE